MINKILLALCVGLLMGAVPAPAQAVPAKVKGRIVAARVQGVVNAISKTTGQSHVLHDGDAVSDQTEVVTLPAASVILAFSNGATVNVAANSTLDVDEFLQDPFASDLKVSDLKQEPGTSITKLNLIRGELVGKVAHLNVDKGSEFTIQTAVGAAGIRGTTFEIAFVVGTNGQATVTISTSEGTVVYTGTAGNPVGVTAGTQVKASFTPGANPPLSINTQGLSPAAAAQIQVQVQAIISANANVIFAPSTNGASAGGSGVGGSAGGNSGNSSNSGTGNGTGTGGNGDGGAIGNPGGSTTTGNSTGGNSNGSPDNFGNGGGGGNTNPVPAPTQQIPPTL